MTAIPPRYVTTIADHVTLASDGNTLPAPANITIIGEADDTAGVQALVVTVDGVSERPDGGTYHITWSLDPGRKAVESNSVIAQHGWRTLAEPYPVATTPARWTWVDA